MGALGAGVGALINAGLLPLASILIEPAKVFFLNNAINHGVLTPLGIEMAKTTGKSVLFLLEANPGPGLGILLAYSIFGKGNAKASAPGAAIIHFLGGIHEIYFPFVLMRPILILAMIAGGMTGVFVNVRVRCRPARTGRSGFDPCGVRPDRSGQLPRCDDLLDRRSSSHPGPRRDPAAPRQGP